MESPPGAAKTLIFLSADIVEATKFKDSVRGPDENPAWFDAFEAFFRELPLVFMGQVATAFAEVEELPNIKVWKVFGDEIIFRVQSRSADDALRLTEAFHHALVAYGARFHERWPLHFRGCIWAARFPGRNIEFEIPEMAAGGEAADSAYTDYLGPDVDLGFRLAHHAERSQLIVSLNLAEALAALPTHRGIRFLHAGQAVLKGVFHGRPYPLIMIAPTDCAPGSLRGDPPIAADKLIALAERARGDLNAAYNLKLRRLEF
jgi:class 3 adenylate cyclase